MFAVIVCGGRDEYLNSFRLSLLREFFILNNVSIVITGGAKGVDQAANNLAKSMELTCEVYEAQWSKYGNAAGPIRNRQMMVRLKEIEDTMQHKISVVAFPGGTGTKNMKMIAKKNNVRIVEFP